jgi:hypothetical protein
MFEGDIVLNIRPLNGVIDQDKRWPGRTVPFYIDPVFSKYCSIMIESGIEAWRELSMHFKHHISSSTHWKLRGRSNVGNQQSLPLNTIIHSHTQFIPHIKSNTQSQPCKHKDDTKITVKSN